MLFLLSLSVSGNGSFLFECCLKEECTIDYGLLISISLIRLVEKGSLDSSVPITDELTSISSTDGLIAYLSCFTLSLKRDGLLRSCGSSMNGLASDRSFLRKNEESAEGVANLVSGRFSSYLLFLEGFLLSWICYRSDL